MRCTGRASGSRFAPVPGQPDPAETGVRPKRRGAPGQWARRRYCAAGTARARVAWERDAIARPAPHRSAAARQRPDVPPGAPVVADSRAGWPAPDAPDAPRRGLRRSCQAHFAGRLRTVHRVPAADQAGVARRAKEPAAAGPRRLRYRPRAGGAPGAAARPGRGSPVVARRSAQPPSAPGRVAAKR